MKEEIRKAYNQAFTPEKYQEFLSYLDNLYSQKIAFRVAETPVFVPKQLKNRLIEAGEEIVDVIMRPDFKEITRPAVPAHQNVPNEDNYSVMLTIDFAVCKDETGQLIPQLIEMQGFPSLYGFQDDISNAFRKFFAIPDNFSHLFSGLNSEKYVALLKNVILGDQKPENVILLEIEPHKQKTNVDFYSMEKKIGIKPICITDILVEGRNLFYMLNGTKTKINRIYNRVIFDELEKRTDLKLQFNMLNDVDVEWAGHPNWFFRISKYTLPFINSKYVPKTYFLNEIREIPRDLENYVLKPLFSFAGAGVKFDVKVEDITQIPQEERQNFILQKKVKYIDALVCPDNEPIKVEIRMMYLWEKGKERPTLVTNLARLSKGVMIGVDFNKNRTWVGGTANFFEQD